MLSLDRLQSFVVFVESKNIFEAAEQLGMAQPTLSVHLRQLEEELGQPLFGLKGKKKVLNHFGQAFYNEVRPQVESLNRSIQSIRQRYNNPSEITLKVAGRGELLRMAAQCSHFAGRLDFVPMGSDLALKALADNQVDLALTHLLPSTGDLHAKKFIKDGAQLIVSRRLLKNFSDNELSTQKSKEFLKATPFISYKEKETLSSKWLKHCGLSTKDLATKIQIDDWNAVVELVDQEKGFAITPSSFAPKSKNTLRIPLPQKVVPGLQLYILYQPSLREIAPIRDIFNFR